MHLWSSLLWFAGTPVWAQSPEDTWRTVETEHYRLHYPLESEAWALYSAARLEAIRAIVSAEVGYSPPQRVDVVAMDPFAQANGFAIPLLGGPRMGVFPTPPEPASGIGHYRSWTEDLIVHEDAHLVHLLRPSRNPGLKAVGTALGVGPISLNSPAWVVEGYATVVEGRLTGMGRPNSNGRAAFLRRLVLDGDMPAYAELDAPSRWASGAYRYLVGSAFLEWLEARTHEDALIDLWDRMTAVEIRDFEDAFLGVFGDSPESLYRRFVAELTYEALLVERVRPEDADTLWQDLEWSVDAPAVSPDGAHIALLQRPKLGAPRLVIYATAPDEEARTSWEEDHLPDLEKDPEDVAPTPPLAYPLEPVHERALGGYIPSSVRWIDDQTVLFTSFQRDASGDLHPELFSWSLADGGSPRPLTRRAHVRDADPHGRVAYGLQTQGGLSRLIRVDLDDPQAAPVPLTQDGPAVALSQPRVRPDGGALAWVANRGQGWQIEVAPLSEAGVLAESPAVVALPPGAEVLSIAWRADGGGLVASLGRGGFVELYDLSLDGGAGWQQLTRSRGGADDPAPMPDGSAVFYLVTDFEGPNLHRLALDQVQQPAVGTPDDATVRAALRLESPTVRPATPPIAPPLAAAEVTAQPYGLGKPHTRITTGATVGPQQSNLEAGLSAGDVVGRYELVGIVSLGEASLTGTDSAFAWRGARVGLTWRGLPVRLRLEGVQLSFLEDASPDLIGTLDVYRQIAGAHSGAAARVSGLWFSQDGTATTGVDGGLSGYAQHWAGPVWLGAGADLLGQGRLTGETGTTMRAGGWLGWGSSLFSMSGEAELIGGSGPISLGGVAEVLYPEAFSTPLVWAPGLAPASLAPLSSVQRYRGDLSVAGVGLFGEHHEVEVDTSDILSTLALTGGYTRFGLETKGLVPPQPLVATAGLFLEAGVACTTETPEEGWRSEPCRDLDSWSAWLSIRVQPGTEAPIPRSPRDLSPGWGRDHSR